MSGRKPWREFTKKWSPGFKEKVAKRAAVLSAELPSHALQNSRAAAHELIDDRRNANLRPDASRNGNANLAIATEAPTAKQLEADADAYIAAIRVGLAAHGGTLRITAQFREGDVKIARFSEIDEYQFTEI